MKTSAEVKFDNIIKQGFHEVLKSKGFRKKGNNFYLQLPELGQTINIQKSAYYSKDHIQFTINIGIFLPEHWREFLNHQGKELPVFPTERECLIRKRIGDLINQDDTWYDVDGKTDEVELISEMKGNLEQYILPYFGIVSSKKDLLTLIDANHLDLQPLEKLRIYGKMNLIAKAKAEYDSIFQQEFTPSFLERVKEYGRKYGLS